MKKEDCLEFFKNATPDEIVEKLYEEEYFKAFLAAYTHETKKEIDRDWNNCRFYPDTEKGFTEYREECIDNYEDDEEVISYGWSQLQKIHDLIRFDWYA